MIASGIPSESLLGLALDDGWQVVEFIHKDPRSTGGGFSSGYRVQRGSEVAYLKALDFSSAFGAADVPRELQSLTEAFNFERDLLYKCKNRKLDKVVTPISDGSVDAPGFPQYINKVYYIIFELSDGDIRKIKDTFATLNLAFIYRSLHNVALGLQQLHGSGVAHQDLKPSNVLVFDKDSKVGDLGRASDLDHPFKYDSYVIPGDRNYAPIEQKYAFHFSNDFTEKFAADFYLLGSLFFFHFTGLSASQSLHNQLVINQTKLTSDFRADLPEIEHAFADLVADLEKTIRPILKNYESCEDTLSLVKWLCNPNPEKRGHPTNITEGFNKYSLERIISKLDVLAQRAELGLI